MKFVLTILALSTLTLATGQTNLVINPSFEDTVSCPDNLAQISRAFRWTSYGDSPEYFNSCSTSTYSLGVSGESVPFNFAGYQQAASGKAYAAFTAYGGIDASPPNFREFIGGNLSSSLVVGTKYFVSFKVSLCINPTTLNLASNNLGASFSTIPYVYPNYYPISNNPKINTALLVTDSLYWTNISGSFIADSAYSHVIIGNFFDDANTNTLIMDGSTQNKWAYYYLDDVCVSTDSLTCIQPVGIHYVSNNNKFKISPNPTSDQSILKFDNTKAELCTLTLYDLRGQIVRTINNITSDQVVIQKNDLPNGLYYFVLRTGDRVIVTGKLAVD